jgi:hypothetical protein
MSNFRKSQTTSKDQSAETPSLLMKALYKDFKLSWDPCPSVFVVDGLTRDWIAGAYVNPPFQDTNKWLDKAKLEQTYSLFLIPFSKLHRQFMKRTWESVRAIWLFSSLITFKTYNKPLNTAMALVSMNECHGPKNVPLCHMYSWIKMKTRTLSAIVEILEKHAPVDLVLSDPAKTLPSLLQQRQFVVVAPSRMDLKWIRQHLAIFDEIILCPTVKIHKTDKNNLWMPSIILVKGMQIAKHVDVDPHSVPVYEYVTKFHK